MTEMTSRNPPPFTDECQIRRESEMEHVNKGQGFGSATNMDCLPDGVLCQIFSYLPTKSAFRCRCVSRRWYSLIPRGSASFCDYYQIQRPFTALFDLYDPNQGAISRFCHVHDSPEPTSLDHMFSAILIEHNTCTDFHVLASYKDLVLCGSFLWATTPYYICNLFTKQYVMLPSPGCTNVAVVPFGGAYNSDLDVDKVLFGLLFDEGYDQNQNSTPRFWVVVMGYNNLSLAKGTLRGEIFSSQTRQWVCYSFAIRCPFPFISHWHKGVPCNGKLYWCNTSGGLLEFDPLKMGEKGSRYISFINVPHDDHRYLPYLPVRCLGSCSGKLRLSQIVNNIYTNPYYSWRALVLYIWEFDEEKDIHTGSKCRSLSLKHRLSLQDFSIEDSSVDHEEQLASLRYIHTATVLYFHPYDSDIIYLELNHEIVLCNLRKKSLRFVRSLPSGSCVLEGSSFVLQHPCFPSPVPVLSQELEDY